MKKSALRFLILTWLFKVALCGWNVAVKEKKTWSEARKYCREHHADLSSISNQEEDDSFVLPWFTTNFWIGLYKDVDGAWKWSGGTTASFFNWAIVQNESEDNTCAVQSIRGWRKKNCDTKYRFYCFHSNLVLVKENKTWEEAMEQCRHQHEDLVSLPSETALVHTLQTSRGAQTSHVWTGLRYLADSWLWMNGDNVGYQAWGNGATPQCPGWSHRCGALSVKGQYWESWDCADKLNFVCHQNT